MTDDNPFVRRSILGAAIQQIVCILAAGVILTVIHGCPSAPPSATSSNPTPAPADPCDAACAAMRTAGCAEGGARCEGVCRHVVDSGLTKLDVVCLARALTAAEVRACGVACATDAGP